MGLFDFIKKLFRRGEESIDIGESEETTEVGNIGAPSEDNLSMAQPFLTQPQSTPKLGVIENSHLNTMTFKQEDLRMFGPSFQQQFQQNYQNYTQDYIKDQISLLISKLDVLNAKLDQIIQKLNLIETYIKYR